LAEVPQNSSMLDALNAAGFEGIQTASAANAAFAPMSLPSAVWQTARLIARIQHKLAYVHGPVHLTAH
jgi:hypothetical protein